jgi:hypothetical protein
VVVGQRKGLCRLKVDLTLAVGIEDERSLLAASSPNWQCFGNEIRAPNVNERPRNVH